MLAVFEAQSRRFDPENPDVFIVEGYNPGMPAIDKPPIGLTDQEILAVIAYLQSLGGTPTITLETTPAELGRE